MEHLVAFRDREDRVQRVSGAGKEGCGKSRI